MDEPTRWASCGEAWIWLMRHVRASGEPADDDRGPVIEGPAVLFEISDVRWDDPILREYGDPVKRMLYARKFTEAEVIPPFKYSYGQRLTPQMEWAIRLLRARPYSKSAWVSLTRPGEPYDAVPCLAAVAVRIRDGALAMTATFRSQNAYTCYLNYVPLREVQAGIARDLGLDCGPMRVFVDVPHLYLADLTQVERIARS
ncbi:MULTISPECIES: thymidylate synthase family protein [Nonomuraea]|uniref:Thymidylate synthase n=2 Tax=Nonomuraea recticatena TaxID=46178 RepID=A0ABN3SEK4_9ACTN